MGRDTFARKLFYSQLALYVTLVVCVILAPAALDANSGISYFGHHKLTVVPFAIGFAVSDFLLFQAWQMLRKTSNYKVLGYGLSIIIPGLIGIVVAPAIGNGAIDLLHRIFGSIVFVTELVLGFWLVWCVKRDVLNFLIYIFQWAGGIIAFIYLSPSTGYSIEGQMLFQLAFSWLLLKNLILAD